MKVCVIKKGVIKNIKQGKLNYENKLLQRASIGFFNIVYF